MAQKTQTDKPKFPALGEWKKIPYSDSGETIDVSAAPPFNKQLILYNEEDGFVRLGTLKSINSTNCVFDVDDWGEDLDAPDAGEYWAVVNLPE